ncbi:unnamed protein product [Lota lota]
MVLMWVKPTERRMTRLAVEEAGTGEEKGGQQNSADFKGKEGKPFDRNIGVIKFVSIRRHYTVTKTI